MPAFEELLRKELERMTPEQRKKPLIATFQAHVTGEELLEALKKGKKIEEILR